LKGLSDDAVLLEIEGDLRPPGPQYFAKLGSARESFNGTFVAFGFSPIAEYAQRRVNGRIQGSVRHVRKSLACPAIQLEVDGVYNGMSGAPVLDVDRSLVVAMISDRYNPADTEPQNSRFAWAVDAEVLARSPFELKVAKSVQTASESRFLVPVERNVFFYARPEISGAIAGAFKRSDEMNGRVVLSGLRGVGKTEIALDYAYSNRDRYSAVIWVDATSRDTIDQSYDRIHQALGYLRPGEELVKKQARDVDSWLTDHPGWLLVFDSTDNLDLIARYLPQQPKGNVLVTSSQSNFDKIGVPQPISIESLTAAIGQEFLLTRIARELYSIDETTAALELSKLLGGLPLALEQAGSYIKQTGSKITAYLSRYKEHRLRLLALGTPIRHEPVATTWQVHLETIRGISRTGVKALEILRCAAFLAPNNIPLAIFRVDVSNLLAQSAGSIEDKPPADVYDLEDYLEPLVRFSLVRVTPATDRSAGSFQIHPLVQEVVRDALDARQSEVFNLCALQLLNTAYPDVETYSEELGFALPHAVTATQYAGKKNLRHIIVARSLGLCGRLLKRYAAFQESVQYHQAAISLAKELGEFRVVVASLINLGVCLQDSKQFQLARKYFGDALNLIREHRIDDPNLILTISTNLCYCCYLLHDRQGKAYGLRALRLAKQVANPTLYAANLNHLALIVQREKKPERAIILFQRALDIMQTLYGKKDHRVGITMSNLSSAYLARRIASKESQQKALKLACNALSITRRTLGATHPDVAKAMGGLGILVATIGRFKPARSLLTKAYQLNANLHGSDNSSTNALLSNLASLYLSAGYPDEAASMYEQVADTYERVGDLKSALFYFSNLVTLYNQMQQPMYAQIAKRRAQRLQLRGA
jgi:tetratricopeptide (TPR) repeat protein